MGLELDYLKNNADVKVIYNTVNGDVIEFYDWEHFKKVLKKEFGVEVNEIPERFGKDELIAFFSDRDCFGDDWDEFEDEVERLFRR